MTFFTSIQCEAAFGFPTLSSAPEVKSNAVASQALWASDQQQLPLMDDEISHGQQDSPLVKGIDDDDRDSSSKAFAACLATPIEPPPEFQGQAEVRLVFIGSKSDILSNRLVGFAVQGGATKNRYSRKCVIDIKIQNYRHYTCMYLKTADLPPSPLPACINMSLPRYPRSASRRQIAGLNGFGASDEDVSQSKSR